MAQLRRFLHILDLFHDFFKFVGLQIIAVTCVSTWRKFGHESGIFSLQNTDKDVKSEYIVPIGLL